MLANSRAFLGVKRHMRYSSLRIVFLLLTLCLMHADRTSAAEAPWRFHEVYEPVIESYFISDPSKQALQYNHCSAIAFFKNRWVAIWNANRRADESKPG